MTHIRCEHGQYPHCKKCNDLAEQGEADNILVQQHRPRTLADMYRAGKAAGYLRPVKGYH